MSVGKALTDNSWKWMPYAHHMQERRGCISLLHSRVYQRKELSVPLFKQKITNMYYKKYTINKK